MQKRHQLGELRPFFPLLGMTLEEATAWLAANPTRSPVHSYYDVSIVRPLGGPITMDHRVERLNVRLDDAGKIVHLDGCY